MVNATMNCGCKVELGVEATPEMLTDFDGIIIATGATTFKPEIHGAQDPSILDPLKVLDNKDCMEGEHVVICGAGLVGCEVALEIAEKGKKVTLVDMVPTVAPGLTVFTKWVMQSYLAELGVQVKINHKIVEMTGNKVVCEHEGEKVAFEGDNVICALGLKPVRGLWEELKAENPNVEIIPVGDINSPRKILQAVHEGLHAGRRI